MRTRSAGHRNLQLHVIDGSMSLREAHRIMDEIEAWLHAEFPEVEIIIHPDPGRHSQPGGA